MLVGTAFYTTLAKRIVTQSLWKGVKVIEINKESSLGKLSKLN
jgi:hypothetical protein